MSYLYRIIVYLKWEAKADLVHLRSVIQTWNSLATVKPEALFRSKIALGIVVENKMFRLSNNLVYPLTSKFNIQSYLIF